MIKKLMLKVAIKFGIIVGIMLVVPYYFYNGGQLPDLMGVLDFSREEAKPPVLPENISSVTTDREVTVYQWLDANGIRQFGSTPPAGVEAEVMQLKPDRNVIQAVKIPRDEEASAEKQNQVEEPVLKNPYNPETVKKMIEDAKNVQKLLDQRFEDQNQVMESIK